MQEVGLVTDCLSLNLISVSAVVCSCADDFIVERKHLTTRGRSHE